MSTEIGSAAPAGAVSVGLEDGRRLAARVRVAKSSWARFLGLMGRRRLDPEEGLWLLPCRSIHMFFMRTAIDVVFLDRQGRAVRAVSRMRPWSLRPFSVTLLPVRSAHSALELAPGTLERIGFKTPCQLVLAPAPVPGAAPALS